MGGAAISNPADAMPRAGARFGQLDRYLVRGVAGPFAVVFAAVAIALMLERALRLIHELAASGADIGYFLPLLGQLVPYYLELAVPLAASSWIRRSARSSIRAMATAAKITTKGPAAPRTR